MVIEFSSILSLIVIFQLLFIAVFLLTSTKGRRISNIILGIFFILVAINLTDLVLSLHGLYPYYARIALLDDGFFLAFGPLIYLYTNSIIYKDFNFRKSGYWHFIPFVLFTVFLGLSQYMIPAESQVEIVTEIQTGKMPLGAQVFSVAIHLHILFYSYLAYIEVQKFRSAIRQRFSTIEKINLDWLNFIIKTLAVIILFSLINNLIPFTFLNNYVWVTLIILILFLLYFITRVIFTALKQPLLFSGIETEPTVKYAGSTLSESERLRHKKTLEKYMESDQPYLNSDLNLDQLADALNIHAKPLSQVINQSFQKSFFDYINGYRIKEAKRLLSKTEDDKLTVQEVMYQSGFNSKSSFIAFFKKETGQTPSQFRKSLTEK